MKFVGVLLLIMVSSCSTMKRTKIYSAVAGGVIGGFLGAAVGQSNSPNSESDNFNQNIGGGVGIAMGGIAGMYLGKVFYTEDPENLKGEPVEIKYNRDVKPENQMVPLLTPRKIDLGDLGVKLDSISSKSYLPRAKIGLPKKYKDDVYKQMVITHKIPTRKIKLENGKTYILKETELIEHRFVE